MPQVIKLADLAGHAGDAEQEDYTNGDYILRHIVSGKTRIELPATIRIDGLSIFMCTGGEAEITINFHTVRLSEGSVVILSPNDLVELIGDPFKNVDGYALFLPIDFLKSLSLDSNTLDYSEINLDASPVIQLDDDRQRLFNGYFNLLELNATINREPSVYTRSISRSVVGAMIYQLMAFSRSQQGGDEYAGEKAQASGRRRYYVRDFMTLLQQDFRQHRSVGYYADRLFISAKYLSLIIKEATGRTATDWIDHFVILEAKNLLRYSGRNIQQIAYDLNFHNQSAFGKYFKHLTGLSPSEFRKT